MKPLKVLSIAVSSGRAGYVFIENGQLRDWGIILKATSNPTEIAGFAQEIINDLRPEIVVTEKCDEYSRKGKKTRKLIKAIAETASHNSVLDVSVPRPRFYPSKYEEAEELAKRYPEIVGYLPSHKRRIFDYEPRRMILFEALALAESVTGFPPERLAAAMG